MSTLVQEEVEVLELISTDTDSDEAYHLIVYNDDVNTFDYVIVTLMEVCGHTLEQAEQCSTIIHYKGKCSVKTGSFDRLVPMRNEICRRGISAEVV